MISGRGVLLTEVRGHIYLMTINRPERKNSLTPEFYERWEEELEHFNENEDLWVAVLTGSGTDAFCAGMDLKEYSERVAQGLPDPRPVTRRKPHPWVPTWKPLVAAINGHALAGGWDIAQQCDLRIASEEATLGITEVKWNLPAPFAGESHNFPTKATASEVTLMGRPISAQRAYEIGFVNKVVPPGEVLPEALAWAEHLCTLGQESVRAHKQVLYQGRWAPPSEMTTLTEDLFYWWGKGKPGVVVDSTVGSRAFAERRQPDFSEMFNPPRFRCEVCHAEYLLTNGKEPDTFTCHGQAPVRTDQGAS